MDPKRLLLFILALGFLLAFVQVGLLTLAFDRLGLSPASGFILLFGSLFGSLFNIPLFTVQAEPPRPGQMPPLARQWQLPQWTFTDRTVIALNLGGGLLPILFSAYLIGAHRLDILDLLLPVTGVSVISYASSRPIPGLGIGMPILIAPISAALLAVLTTPAHAPAVAYVSGTLGVLMGADLLRLRDIGRMGTPVAAIGGAGTFDGIFLSGLVAVLLV